MVVFFSRYFEVFVLFLIEEKGRGWRGFRTEGLVFTVRRDFVVRFS